MKSKHLSDVLSEKNGSLARHLNFAKEAAMNRWLRSLDPKNGFTHSCSVERYLDQLIPDEIKEKMTAAEIFILLYATLLHDIGRKFVGWDGHEKASFDEISSNFKEYYLTEHEAQVIAQVAYGHASEEENPINSIHLEWGIENLDSIEEPGLRFLVALLRVADEIDNAFTRVWGLPEHKNSERTRINFVKVDPIRWIITFKHDSKSDEERRRILLNVDKAQRRLDEVKEILESQGILFHLVDTDPLLPGLTGFRAFGKVRSDYLRYLQRSFRFLDFRGILHVRKLVKIKLDDIYIPLYALNKGIPLSSLEDERIVDGNDLALVSEGLPHVAETRQGGIRQPIKDVLQHNRVVILGPPGSGKSTLLKYIVLAIADENASEKFGLPEGILPIIVSIRSYADALKENSEITLGDFFSAYYNAIDFSDADSLPRLFSFELQNGNCIILLDGLDEVREPSLRIEVGTRINHFIDEYGSKNRIVITSRIQGYMGAQLHRDYEHYIIAEFTDENIQNFVRKWCLAFEEITTESSVAEMRADSEAEKLLDEIISNSGIRRLASNPLLLTILALVHYQGMRLPPRRVDLYELCIETLAETWNLARNMAGISLEVWLGNRPLDVRYLSTVLGPVALWMQDEGKGLISRRELEERIAGEIQKKKDLSLEEANEAASNFVSLVVEHSGLIVEFPPDSFRFMHQTFQEYFAARTLVGMRDVDEFVLKRLDESRWREPILLTAALLEGDYVDDFVGMIKNAKDRYEPIVHRHLILAAWCLVDDAQVSHNLSKKILSEMKNIYTDPFTPDVLRNQISRVFAAMKGGSYEQDSLLIIDQILRVTDSQIISSAARTLGMIGDDRAVELLIKILEDDNSNVRSSAARALGEIGDDRAVEPLIERLKEHNSEVWSSAAWALGEIGDDRAVEPLIKVLRDTYRYLNTSKIQQSSLALALGIIGGDMTVKLLIELLRTPHNKVRNNATYALGNIGGDMTVKLLIEALRDSDVNVRSSAVRILGKIGDIKAVEPLLEEFRNLHSNVRSVAARALGEIGDIRAFEPLLEELWDPYSNVRSSAVRALGGIGDIWAFEPLLEERWDPHPNVRANAARSLRMIGGVRAVEPLIEMFRDPNTNVRANAARGLSMIGDERAVEPLIELLGDPESHVQSNAAWALGNIGDKRAVEPLIELLWGPNLHVWYSAAEGLGDIGDDRAVEPLITGLKESNPYFPYNTSRVLGKLGDNRAIEPLIETLRNSDPNVRSMAFSALLSCIRAQANQIIH